MVPSFPEVCYLRLGSTDEVWGLGVFWKTSGGGSTLRSFASYRYMFIIVYIYITVYLFINSKLYENHEICFWYIKHWSLHRASSTFFSWVSKISGWLDFEARQVVRATRIWAQGGLVGNNWWPEGFFETKIVFFPLTETSAWKRNKGLLKFPSTENQKWSGCGSFRVRNVHQQKICGMGSSYLNPIVFFSQFRCPSFCQISVAAVGSWCIWSVLCWPLDVLGYHRDDFKKD